MKKSIKVIGKPVEEVYIIRDIEIDQVALEKWSVECRSDIADAWGATEGHETFPDDEKTLEIILKEKISNVKFTAKANVIEKVAKMGGKVVKDIKMERAKRGKKNYLSDIIFFKEAT